ncbi:MAG: hypothetical protein KC444_03620 [Nitrosopumilus sp.]|nr:hypothetical protein [Nitrosopumilus sp.]
MTEIVKISKGSKPQQVFDEGDSLAIGSKIHSFYWDFDGPKKIDDYEPVGVKDECGFTRFHYHGLIIWTDFVKEETKPVVSFFTSFHTPVFCTKHNPVSAKPGDIIHRLHWKAFMKLWKILDSKDKYETEPYSSKLKITEIHSDKKFTLNKAKYLILFTPDGKIDSLPLSDAIKLKLKKISVT